MVGGRVNSPPTGSVNLARLPTAEQFFSRAAVAFCEGKNRAMLGRDDEQASVSLSNHRCNQPPCKGVCYKTHVIPLVSSIRVLAAAVGAGALGSGTLVERSR